MSRKYRKKKTSKASPNSVGASSPLRELFGLSGHTASETKSIYQQQREATRDHLKRYKRYDAALALSLSELWPGNVSSPVKHIFAWCVLLGLGPEGDDATPITDYQQFADFLQALYATWPEFPMLEDYSTQADWGQVKVALGDRYVPMLYGSVIERTVDFIEAFRITYAHSPSALVQMDAAITLQAKLIEAMPWLSEVAVDDLPPGTITMPPEDFWQAGGKAVIELNAEHAQWQSKLSRNVFTKPGTFKAPLSEQRFTDAIMQGTALPYIGFECAQGWVPIAIRNAPALLIDLWAQKSQRQLHRLTHQQLADFVVARVRKTVPGPLLLLLDEQPLHDLPITCISIADSGVYLTVACTGAELDQHDRAAQHCYDSLKRGAALGFNFASGQPLKVANADRSGLGFDEVHIILVMALGTTALGQVAAPKRPTRLLPLADFVSLIDNLEEIDELTRFWQFLDEHQTQFRGMFTGPIDLFAAFRDSHGVLVEGATSFDHISIDPHWGTAWRFQKLAEFWAQAPRIFPDGSSAWLLDTFESGVVYLSSRRFWAQAYSIQISGCTMQSLLEARRDLSLEQARTLDLFAQLLVDCARRCAHLIAELPIFTQEHLLFLCFVDPQSVVDLDDDPQPLENLPSVLTAIRKAPDHPGKYYLRLNVQTIFAGLNQAKTAAFEVQCLLETLEACHNACGLHWPADMAERLRDQASQPARFHLIVDERLTDVPDYVDPVIPTPTHYKLARKQLAQEIVALGFTPGRYELAQAKAILDPAARCLRLHLEQRLARLDKPLLIKALVEQHDALLISERNKIQRAQQSQAHEVDYDRKQAVQQAREELGLLSRHYRYLLEKTLSLPSNGSEPVDDDTLRELGAIVDWYRVLAGASDVLHNGIDVGGMQIDDDFIAEVFYSNDFDSRDQAFANEYAQATLGLGIQSSDAVLGDATLVHESAELQQAFLRDLGFELKHLLASLAVLSQAMRYGLGDKLALSFSLPAEQLPQHLSQNIEQLALDQAQRIVTFLTLDPNAVLRLAGRDKDEADVPTWDRSKRLHRYAIRPLIAQGTQLIWGAETARRCLHIWTSAVIDGRLPAEFSWPKVNPVIRTIKEGIEKRLEQRAAEIFRRYTPYVECGVDFRRRYRDEQYADVGDYDVFAYWPELNLLITVECKYNHPPYTQKDGRRLRDLIFASATTDRKGQYSRIQGRQQFIEQHRAGLLERLKWPQPHDLPIRNLDLYVCREVNFWMLHPPYPVPTQFVRVDRLDRFIQDRLLSPE